MKASFEIVKHAFLIKKLTQLQNEQLRLLEQLVEEEATQTSGLQHSDTKAIQRRARTSAAMIGLALSMGASDLLIPRSEKDLVSEADDSQQSPSSSELVERVDTSSLPSRITHRVTLGDTITEIARLYGVDVETVIDINQLSDQNITFVGQVLQIPTSKNNSDRTSDLSLNKSESNQLNDELEDSPINLKSQSSYLRELLKEIKELREKYNTSYAIELDESGIRADESELKTDEHPSVPSSVRQFSSSIYRFSLPRASNGREVREFKRYVEILRQANPEWVVIQDWTQSGEQEAVVMLKKDKDYTHHRISYMLTRAFSSSFQGAYGR